MTSQKSMQRRIGRPPLDAASKSVPVTVRVPGPRYDQLYARAQRAGVTVPEIIRRDSGLVTPKVDDDDDGDA
jgi:hypothetical protein